MGQVRQPSARSPSMSAKSLVDEAPSRNRPKIAADEPGLPVEDRLHRRPARHLEQQATRDRDGHVGPGAEALGAQRGRRVGPGEESGQQHDQEALVAPLRRGQPGEHPGEQVGRRRERPDLAEAQGAARERPPGLVHPVDGQVVDLVHGVAAGVEDPGHQHAEDDGKNDGGAEGRPPSMGAPGGGGPAEEAQHGHEDRDRPGEIEVGPGLGHRDRSTRSTAKPAPIAVLSAFSRLLSSQPRRSATVPITLSARLPRTPARVTRAASCQV